MSNQENELNKLIEIEKRKLTDLTKAYSDEEYRTVVTAIPDDYLWEELIRRNSSTMKDVDSIAETLGVSIDNITPISAKAWDEMKARYDDLKEKIARIRKITGGVLE